MTTPTRLFAAAAAAALVVTACGGDDGDGGSTASDVTAVRVGSAGFPENELLMQIYGQSIADLGIEVSYQPNIGSREVYYASIEGGDIDLVPEYTNSLLSFVSRQAETEPEATNTDEQITELGEKLPEGLQVLEPSSAEDKDSITCNAETVEQYDLTDYSSLVPVSGEIIFGGPPEFADRAPFGVPGLAEFDIVFKEFRPLDTAGPLTVAALESNEVNCANLFTTQSAIVASGFVTLEDDLGVVPAENVTPLIRSEVASEAVVERLDAVSAALDTEQLKTIVARVEVDAEDPADVAADWLAEAGILGS
jgi:osmoprotectant transport system substrate-binding protein